MSKSFLSPKTKHPACRRAEDRGLILKFSYQRFHPLCLWLIGSVLADDYMRCSRQPNVLKESADAYSPNTPHLPVLRMADETYAHYPRPRRPSYIVRILLRGMP
jgi:hypothetical protein